MTSTDTTADAHRLGMANAIAANNARHTLEAIEEFLEALIDPEEQADAAHLIAQTSPAALTRLVNGHAELTRIYADRAAIAAGKMRDHGADPTDILHAHRLADRADTDAYRAAHTAAHIATIANTMAATEEPA